MTTVIGRIHELDAIETFKNRASNGPAVHTLTGDPGMGKSTMLNACIEGALDQGFQVLRSSPVASEMKLSFAGLSDLLAHVESSMLDELPHPQRLALDAALLRGPVDEVEPDPRAVASGFLSFLNEATRLRPVLIVVDDIQWLDRPTFDVIEFAARRCQRPFGLLVARRTDEGQALNLQSRPGDSMSYTSAHLQPLPASALHQIIRETTGVRLPRAVVDQVVETSGGNPFFAIELALSVDSGIHDPFALPDGLQSIVRRRLEQVGPAAMELLQPAALLAAPRLEQLTGILPASDAGTLLGEVEDQGIIHLESNGSVRFAHPLLAAGVVAAMSPSRRRALHRRLSEIVDDPEERARHLAMATVGADPVVVRALDHAAEHARKRGAPGVAAELLEMVAGHGAFDAGRICLAAQDHFNAGNPMRARELLEAALDDLGPGIEKASAQALLGIIHFDTDGRSAAIGFLEQAVEQAASDIELRCSIMIDLSFVQFISGQIVDAQQQVDAAMAEVERINDRGLVAEILASSVITDFLSGKGLDEVALNRAIELEDRLRRSPVRRWPSTVAAQVYRWTHQLDLALTSFADIRQRCLDNGLESDLWFVSLGAIPAACWAGDMETARTLTDDALERARVVESDQATAMAKLFETQFLAWIGDIDAARATAAHAAGLFSLSDLNTFGLEIPAALGMVELASGDYEAAARHLTPAARSAIDMRFVEPASAQFLPDAVEALTGTGKVHEAELIVDLLETSAGRPSALWNKAVALRCRGLVLAANGMLQEADEHYGRALSAHDDLPQLRYDRARTLLARSVVLRRLNQRRAARASLVEAAELFEQVGAAGWHRHAQEGLPRLGMQPGSGSALTPSEEQVARLAASGMTNRQVAVALSVSPKTVGSHLTNIYRKLDIRSRAELGWHMAQRSTQD